ncbi:zincin [Terfezia boudieri ATCC MYA-4762]|uniref:Zincin n=1 Tax=Terfezia boudieri ATCC MYA-4762 TaxID=1051890 RepID=A0A3N4M856_9PEZI|nr:zincin [Terfezia boudieri ATCC MYA-4762]
MSPRIPPQAPPAFKHTPQSLLEETRAIIEKSRTLEDGLVRDVKLEEATFENVLGIMARDEDEAGLKSRIIGFYQYVSEDKALRDASSQADKELEDFAIESIMREDIFKLVKAVHNSPASKDLDPESARLLDKTYKSHVRSGLELPVEPERARFKEIKKRLSTIAIDFSKHLNEENGGIWFTLDELEGVPEDVVSGLKKGEAGSENEGKIFLTYKYPDLFPTMKYAVSADVRKRVFMGSENKCNENVPLFKEAITLRDEKARMLGFRNHAEFVLEDKMAKTPEKVMAFLNDLREKLTPGGKRERKVLLELKKKEKEERGENFDGKYYLWDHRYYDRLLLEQEYQLDSQKVAEYFPLSSTIDGMLRIFEEIFGLEFVQMTDKKDLEGITWHEDTKLFQVWNDKPEDGFVGYLYLDLHPREGKYSHAANLNIQPGFVKKDGSRHYPVTALVCNFSKPTKDKPSLLKHEEVTTLFHELGHGIHNLVAETKYSRFHGTSVVGDFVEAPSQMLENWCWTPAQITSLSSHYLTSEKMPSSLVDTIIKAKHVNDALFNLRQLHFAIFDMRMHNIPSPGVIETIQPTIEYNRLRTEIAGLDGPEGGTLEYANGQATFGHLMGRYDAGYYGYLWSQVFSMDMFYTAFKRDPMSGAEGRRYRRVVLRRGGSRDEMEVLKEFLGREPNSKAFLEELGIAA